MTRRWSNFRQGTHDEQKYNRLKNIENWLNDPTQPSKSSSLFFFTLGLTGKATFPIPFSTTYSVSLQKLLSKIGSLARFVRNLLNVVKNLNLDYEDSHHHGPLLCSFQLLC